MAGQSAQFLSVLVLHRLLWIHAMVEQQGLLTVRLCQQRLVLTVCYVLAMPDTTSSQMTTHIRLSNLAAAEGMHAMSLHSGITYLLP